MKNLRKKLHSQSGASILLALLFFLACMMVAASVLMAAVSNAGKLRSNYDEQQKYLALSSALRLVAGELEQAQYTGKYQVARWTVPILDDESNVIDTIKYYHVQQAVGEYTRGRLENTMDFTSALDGLFAEEFTGRAGCSPRAEVTAPPAAKTVTVSVGGGPADPAVKEKFLDVGVEVILRRDLRIQLTAVLEPTYDADGKLIKENKYLMQAELKPSGLPTLNFTPGSDEHPWSAPGGGSVPEDKTLPITWKLDWIAKEVGGA